MTVQNDLPTSYVQQWGTFYTIFAGPRPMSAQEVVGVLTPWLTGKLKTSQMPEVKSARVTVIEDPDLGPTIMSKPFENRQAGALANTVVTGVKWNLRMPNYSSFTTEFASELRSGWRSTGRQAMTALGFKELLFSFQPYGIPPGGGIVDYGFPPTPELPPAPAPTDPPKPIESPKPVPKIVEPVIIPKHSVVGSVTYWMIGASALIFVAAVTKKINGTQRQGVVNGIRNTGRTRIY